jgi:hypothetical protein
VNTYPTLSSPVSGVKANYTTLFAELKGELTNLTIRLCTTEHPVLYVAVYYRQGERINRVSTHKVYYRVFVTRKIEDIFSSDEALAQMVRGSFDRLRVFKLTHESASPYPTVQFMQFHVSAYTFGKSSQPEQFPLFIFCPTSSRAGDTTPVFERWIELV